MPDTPWTPGPWEVGTQRPYIAATTTPNESTGTVVTFGTPSGGSTYWPAIGVGGISHETARANARLIAKAPEMANFIMQVSECQFATEADAQAEADRILNDITGQEVGGE